MMVITLAITTVFAEPVWAAQSPSANPKMYTAGRELGAYLDKQLLAHKKEIVFCTLDRSLMSYVSPTFIETKLDYCSVMLYGIKHDRNISWETVMNSHIEVSPPTVEGGETKKNVKYTFAYYRVRIKPKYRYSKAKDRKFYKRIQSVAKKAKKKKGVRNRARYINDYIRKNVSYNVRRPYHNTAYSALMKGKASCQGYSDSFTLIAREAGLKAETVCGYARLNGRKAYHAWNLTKSGKKWVQTDVTFNDAGGGYKYFMVGKKKFNKDHKLDKFYNNKKWKKAHPLK